MSFSSTSRLSHLPTAIDGRSAQSTRAAWLTAALVTAAICTSCALPRQPEDERRQGGSAVEGETPETAPTPPESLAEGDFLAAEVTTVGWDAVSQSPVVLLRELGSGQIVPIWVGVAEARAIAVALVDMAFPRPMTHDLMADLLEQLGARLEEVVVHDLRNGTYYGLLKLRVPGSDETRLVDTRPSDGIALALRTDATIRVARKIVEQQPNFDFLAPEEGEQVVRLGGLTVVAATEEERRERELPDRPGVLVTRAVGNAQDAGLRRGDFIVEVNGSAPESPAEFLEAARRSGFAKAVRLICWRAGELLEMELFPDLPPPARGRSGTVASLSAVGELTA